MATEPILHRSTQPEPPSLPSGVTTSSRSKPTLTELDQSGMSELLAPLEKVNISINRNAENLAKLNETCDATHASLEYTQADILTLKNDNRTLKDENINLKSHVTALEQTVNDMQRQISNLTEKIVLVDNNARRNSFKIDGVSETEGEDLANITIDIIQHILPNFSRSDIDKSFRLGKPGTKPWTILVTLIRESGTDIILSEKAKLKEIPTLQSIWINDNTHPVIKKLIDLRLITKLAVKEGYEAKAKGNGIVVHSIYYSYSDLDLLPGNLRLASTKTKKLKSMTTFYSQHAPLSNNRY